jgi:hypothetical protein
MSKHIKWPDSGIVRMLEQDVQMAEHYVGACPAPGAKVFDRTAGKDEEIGTITELHVDPKDPTVVLGTMSLNPSPELALKLKGQPIHSIGYSADRTMLSFVDGPVDGAYLIGRMPGLATLVNNLRASKLRLDDELKAVAADLRVARLKANKRKCAARARTGRR